MEKENFEILKERLKYGGFGDRLNGSLEKHMKKGSPEFYLQISMEIDQKQLGFKLNFKRSDKLDRYFFNNYDATLTKPDGQQKSHTFYQDQNISAKEAFNMLEGRAVYKTLFNREGKKYQAWLQLDLAVKDDKGKHPVEHYHKKYGFDLEKELKRLPILQMGDREEKARLLYSLKKGNLHQVGLEGKKGNFKLAAFPKFKIISIYDEVGMPLKLKRLQKELGLDTKKDQGPKKVGQLKSESRATKKIAKIPGQKKV